MAVKRPTAGKEAPRTMLGRMAGSGQFVVKGGKSGASTKSLAASVLTQHPRNAVTEHNRKIRTGVQAVTTLKPAGGSLVMTVPAIVRKALNFAAGTELAVTVEGSRMIIEAVEPAAVAMRVRRPKYTLDELLARSNPEAPLSDEERVWHDVAPVGREVW